MKFTLDNLKTYCCGEDRFALAYSEDNGKHMKFIASIEPLCFATAEEKALVMPFENALHSLRYLLGVPGKTDQRTLFINLMTEWYDSFHFITDDILKVVEFVTLDNISNCYHDPSAVLADYILAGWNDEDLKAFNIYELLHSEVNEKGELEYEQ